jgi:hypothetical protein
MATIPSLALIPSGYKASKVYSVLPTDGSGDFDFTRSGNATRVNSEGLIESVSTNVPRLNYPLIDGVVQGCPSLLLEPERRNLIQYSEDFSQGYWTKTNSSVTSGFISPDGTANAFKLVEDTGSGEKFTQAIISVSNTTIYTASVFVKFAGREWIRFTDAQSSNRIHFNTKTGVFGSVTGTVISYKSTVLGNGWYKLNLTTTSVATAYAIRISLAENDNDVSYTGNGTDGVYIYGAMLEQGSYPTSYIPNFGTALGVTRSAETANNSGDASTFNDSEGVLMVQASALANDLTNRYIAISDGTTSNRILFRYFDGLSNSVSLFVAIIGEPNVEINYQTEDIKDTSKFAIKYKVNDFSLWVNGFEVGVDTSGSVPTGLSTLSFSNAGGTLPFYGNTKQIQYYDSALTDSELETLTSWTSFSEMATSQLYTIE